MEHRLFGTDLVVAHKYKLVSFGRPGSGTWERSGAVPDTLLGPEGSGNTACRRVVVCRRLVLVVVLAGFFWLVGLSDDPAGLGWCGVHCFFWVWARPIS